MLQPRGIPCSSSWISWAGGVHDHPPGLGHSGGQQRPTGPEHQTDRDWLRRSPLTSSDSGTALVPVHAGCNDPGRLQMHQKDWSDCCGVVNMIGQRVLLCGVVAADWCAEKRRLDVHDDHLYIPSCFLLKSKTYVVSFVFSFSFLMAPWWGQQVNWHGAVWLVYIGLLAGTRDFFFGL